MNKRFPSGMIAAILFAICLPLAGCQKDAADAKAAKRANSAERAKPAAGEASAKGAKDASDDPAAANGSGDPAAGDSSQNDKRPERQASAVTPIESAKLE